MAKGIKAISRDSMQPEPSVTGERTAVALERLAAMVRKHPDKMLDISIELNHDQAFPILFTKRGESFGSLEQRQMGGILRLDMNAQFYGELFDELFYALNADYKGTPPSGISSKSSYKHPKKS